MNPTAPSAPGSYHLIFAFQLEDTGGNVASGSSEFLSWDTGNLDSHDVWDDGNAIASWAPSQVADAQAFGCAYHWRLDSTGGYPGPSTGQTYRLLVVPADAITAQVRPCDEGTLACAQRPGRGDHMPVALVIPAPGRLP